MDSMAHRVFWRFASMSRHWPMKAFPMGAPQLVRGGTGPEWSLFSGR